MCRRLQLNTKKMRNNKGLTILEIIIILVIAGVAIPALLAAFADIVGKGADARSVIVATNIAQEKMEEIIKNNRFGDISSIGLSEFVFDPNPGGDHDICPDPIVPDDCPPTYGCSKGNPNCYNYQIIVNYVDGDEADVDGDGVDLDEEVEGETDFKNVKVVITKDGLDEEEFNVTLTTVIAYIGY